MKIYIIRHGETDWNVKRRFQGRSDIELNEEGRRLARVTAEALKDVNFTRIITSPLKRAYETAIIMKRDRDIPIIKDERIIEISFGEYEGLCCGKEGYNIPDPTFMNFFNAPLDYKPPKGAESIEKLCNRTANLFEELVANNELKDEIILISTHGAALRGILSHIYNIGIEDFWKGGVHKNCAISIVEVENGKGHVLEERKVYY